MGELKELLARTEAASGPDKELDVAIWKALCWEKLYHDFPLGWPFSSSIDAAVGLIEKRLPECRWEVTTTGFKPGASIVIYGAYGGAYAATPALALITALLRVEIAASNPSGGEEKG